MTLRELQKEIDNLEMHFIDSSRLRSEYLRKITISFSPIIFILLGFPIAVITNRRERSANIVLAIFCAAIYYLLSLGSEALAVKAIVSPEIIMWAPNMITGLFALYLNYKCVS